LLRCWLAPRIVAGLRGLVSGPRASAALVLSLVSWALQVATYHLVAVAMRFPITVAGSVVEVIAANLAFVLRPTPGSVGVFQLVYALTAEATGLSKDAAVGVAVLLQVLQVLPVLLLSVALAPRPVFPWGSFSPLRGGPPVHPPPATEDRARPLGISRAGDRPGQADWR
jgi:uncharacterized membrane protein YbhN (UPF0104 family)